VDKKKRSASNNKKNMIKKIEEKDYLLAAELIYDTSTSLSEFIFGKREKSIPYIKKLVEIGNNSLGCENVYGYYLNNELVGLYIGYTGEKKKYYEGMPDFYAFLKAFNILEILILVGKLPILNRLLTSKIEKDEYYISNLVVDSRFRGRGIGSILLDHAIENAKKKECISVILDVDMNNKKAVSFYRRMGFKIVDKNEIKIMKEGTYKMELGLRR